MENILEIKDVTKRYPGVVALNHVSFEVAKGEVHALVGENGAGKSTMIKTITGAITPDEGKVIYEGKEYTELNPILSSQIGIEAIYQEFNLAPELTVQENIYMGTKVNQSIFIDRKELAERTKKILKELNTNIDPNVRIKDLTVAYMQLVEIAKALAKNVKLLIMDEPDVFLDFENIIGLSKLINNYEGTIIAISHNRLLLSQCFNKILHLENMELQEFPGTFAEYNQAMLETKVQMAEQATKDAEWIAVQEKLIEKIRAEATYIDNPAKGRQLKARVSYLERLQARQCKNPFIENHGYDFTFPEVERPEDFDPENAPVVISVKDYALSFDRELLKNVSFDIKAGEKVAIVGANGTGKSSMLKDIYESMKSDADRIGYYTQIFDDDPEQLSGGERNIKQLRALCESDAEILFLDEPSSHLDTYAQIALEKAIKEYKGTVLMVTHDFYTVANCADRILLLENGTVREQSGRAYRKSIYKKYFESDIFEAERIRVEREVRINALLRDGKWKEAKNVL